MEELSLIDELRKCQAGELFCQKAFEDEFDRRCQKGLEELSLVIIRRCGGLPLARNCGYRRTSSNERKGCSIIEN
ncbi:hypothetical protein POTOM_007032 [Populus tomentosa]|uniref:Uncharacterized protein n=1 Tax=Populus tomentosa TaxID=118781 RepID=A0A8X8AU74_POPTO|nr:hypothetical protein POTOM_007032 [Populus tomentosa]